MRAAARLEVVNPATGATVPVVAAIRRGRLLTQDNNLFAADGTVSVATPG